KLVPTIPPLGTRTLTPTTVASSCAGIRKEVDVGLPPEPGDVARPNGKKDAMKASAPPTSSAPAANHPGARIRDETGGDAGGETEGRDTESSYPEECRNVGVHDHLVKVEHNTDRTRDRPVGRDKPS